MAENKIAKIPVASHGLHKHTYNYPWLSSINFGDVMPCYINTLRKGEKDNPKAGLYSQLMPIAHNAFATGRYDFKAIFVPFKMVWRPWYYFSEQTEFISNGELMTPHHFPYVDHNKLSSNLLVNDLHLFGLIHEGDAEDPSVTDYDVLFFNPDEHSSYQYYKATSSGARVLRILGALGCMPSFYAGDYSHINILPLLCYFKAFIDYYHPNQFVGSTLYRTVVSLFERDDIDFNDIVVDIVASLNYCSLNFYEDSIFDLAWTNPASPNIDYSTPSFTMPDVTDTDSFLNDDVRVNGNNDGVPYAFARNGFTKYVVDALKSVSMWMKRRQLSGARLIDRFLVSRGVSLSNDSARISYFVGSRKVEIEVSGVENNTDVNLGELAGRGIASSGDKPLSFDCNADDDGIFLVIVSPLPDASFPILFDGFANRQDFNDNYHAEYDKLGSAAVPARVVQTGLDGVSNYRFIYSNGDERVFGFLNQYWDEVQERPRLLGDFILKSRGAEELSAYHTFRLLNQAGVVASLGFVRMNDSEQYQRLFYSDKQENLMLFLRWYGEQYKEKLPLGDSYDWDDDELNRKVSVVVGGSQK